MHNYAGSRSFRLAEGIQLRREKFGLLFYNYRGPRIYFVPSGNLIGDNFFDGRKTIEQLVADIRREHDLPGKELRLRLESLVRLLEYKGLINGQPLC